MKKLTIKRGAKPRTEAPSPRAPPFDAATFLTSVGSGHSSRKYEPKDIIFRQGTAADAVYYIQKGKIQLTVVSEHGKEAITAHLGAGEFFGEGCMAGPGRLSVWPRPLPPQNRWSPASKRTR